MRRILLAATVLLVATSTASAQCGAARVPVRVYLMYGLVSAALSSGMGDLVRKMNRIKNVNASVHEWGEYTFIASRAASEKAAIVIGGHSIGANAAVSAARQLNGKRRVALLLAFDPTQLYPLEPVPSNVRRAILYLQHGNPFGGNPLIVSRATPVSTYARDMGHVEIDKSPQYHAIAMNAVCGIGSTN
jgi:hypothetical protein